MNFFFVSCYLALFVGADFVDAFATLANKGKSTRVLSRTRHERQNLQATAEGKEFALLFDCDGVILETEEFHRLAYNAAFKAAKLTIDGKSVEWSVEYYGKQAKIAI